MHPVSCELFSVCSLALSDFIFHDEGKSDLPRRHEYQSAPQDIFLTFPNTQYAIPGGPHSRETAMQVLLLSSASRVQNQEDLPSHPPLLQAALFRRTADHQILMGQFPVILELSRPVVDRAVLFICVSFVDK